MIVLKALLIINQAGRKWETYPINPKINIDFPYWSIIMRNRFGYGKSRFNLGDKKTAKEMMQAAKEHLDDDMITVKDYVAIIDSAKTQEMVDTKGVGAYDNDLNINIKIQEHQNLDQLTDEEIKELKKEGCL